jgi:hypothetical protein
MAHFYGKVHGKNNGTSTRTGTPNSGLIAEAMGWKGRIEVHLYTLAGEDHYEIHLLNHPSEPTFNKLLASGVLNTTFHKEDTDVLG